MHCSLVWKLHDSTLNSKINRLHEKCLHIICNNNLSRVLGWDNSIVIYGCFKQSFSSSGSFGFCQTFDQCVNDLLEKVYTRG